MSSIKPQLKCHLGKSFPDPSISTVNLLAYLVSQLLFKFQCLACFQEGECLQADALPEVLNSDRHLEGLAGVSEQQHNWS